VSAPAGTSVANWVAIVDCPEWIAFEGGLPGAVANNDNGLMAIHCEAIPASTTTWQVAATAIYNAGAARMPLDYGHDQPFISWPGASKVATYILIHK
jgi:hypothetical protein